MLSHVMCSFIAGCRSNEGIPEPGSTEAQQPWDLGWTQICTVLWYFPPTLNQQREDGILKQVVHTPVIEKSRDWPCINPDLTYSYCFTSRAEGTEAELQLSAGQGRRVRGGQRSCRWAHASAGSPPKGQCGEGGAWHQRSPIMPFHSQDTWVCKALFQHCNLD